MSKLSTHPDNLSRLVELGLWISPQAYCHLPLLVKPPIRLFACFLGQGCQIDAFSYVSPNTTLHATHIGRYCSIGDNVSILSTHPTNRLTTHPFTYESIFGPPYEVPSQAVLSFSGKIPLTTIGNDVWIGSGVRIKSGVKIGNGCIVGAGSVVTKDVPPYHIVGGVPAQLIRPRFDDETVAQLMELEWWQFNLLGMELPWDNVSVVIDQIKSMSERGELQPYQPKWMRLE